VREQMRDQQVQSARSGRDGVAEKSGGPCPEQASCGHRIAALPPALRPLDRLGPLSLQGRAGRPVEECGLELAPPSLKSNPRKRGACGARIARNRSYAWPQLDVRPTSVVAADSGLRRAAEVEVWGELGRGRACGGVHHGMGFTNHLKLVLAPGGLFGALVRA